MERSRENDSGQTKQATKAQVKCGGVRPSDLHDEHFYVTARGVESTGEVAVWRAVACSEAHQKLGPEAVRLEEISNGFFHR